MPRGPKERRSGYSYTAYNTPARVGAGGRLQHTSRGAGRPGGGRDQGYMPPVILNVKPSRT